MTDETETAAEKARVLVIDDDELVREALRAVLESGGYEVLSAADGDEGIRVFEAEHTAIIITDIVMPNREGIETIGELRRIAPDAKIVAISGGGQRGSTDYLRAAELLGADRTLRKPFTSEEILAVTKELLASDK
jgi:CheY-like chemotaxis protein